MSPHTTKREMQRQGTCSSVEKGAPPFHCSLCFSYSLATASRGGCRGGLVHHGTCRCSSRLPHSLTDVLLCPSLSFLLLLPLGPGGILCFQLRSTFWGHLGQRSPASNARTGRNLGEWILGSILGSAISSLISIHPDPGLPSLYSWA